MNTTLHISTSYLHVHMHVTLYMFVVVRCKELRTIRRFVTSKLENATARLTLKEAHATSACQTHTTWRQPIRWVAMPATVTSRVQWVVTSCRWVNWRASITLDSAPAWRTDWVPSVTNVCKVSITFSSTCTQWCRHVTVMIDKREKYRNQEIITWHSRVVTGLNVCC